MSVFVFKLETVSTYIL